MIPTLSLLTESALIKDFFFLELGLDDDLLPCFELEELGSNQQSSGGNTFPGSL
jgi:hypothetical protein